MDFQNFPSGENLYQNLQFFCDLKVVSPHFLNHNGEIWRKGVDLGHPPKAKFGKSCLRGYTPLVQIDTENYHFLAILGPARPHFESHNSEIWREGAGLGLPPHAKFCKNS